ncbi:hypothetical protein RJ498_000382 [Pluralibacter gergoviae]
MSKHSARSSLRIFALPAARHRKTLMPFPARGAPGCNCCTLIAHAIALRERNRQPLLSRIFSFAASTYRAVGLACRYGSGLMRQMLAERKGLFSSDAVTYSSVRSVRLQPGTLAAMLQTSL